ncbi:hypothetical protein PoB_001219300 [Plakobranchus ocellatus]|uniref:Reverse transcriptase domain-containing protein n=1 Tax=Plakobranchus ocellatus TaxID=259542 RepID=A0AAV3YTX2_9GAST|nr:hypothetical protein PoB_001219300 [Plakobranchus ocellatus]
MIVRNINDSEGLKIKGQNMTNLRYVDDTVLIAGTENELQLILDTVAEESAKRELELNIKKTECMLVSKGVLSCDTEIKKSIAITKTLSTR